MSDLHSMSDAEFRSHTKHYIDKLNERVGVRRQLRPTHRARSAASASTAARSSTYAPVAPASLVTTGSWPDFAHR